MKQTDLSYIAGLLDGEAYIGIKKTTDRQNGRINDGYHERIQVRMVDEPAIKFLKDSFGGNYYKEKPHAAKGRPLYCYQASDLKAYNILKTVLPYLRVKSRVAQTVLCLRELKDNPEYESETQEITSRWKKLVSVRRRHYSPAFIAKMESLWQECKDINTVGVP